MKTTEFSSSLLGEHYVRVEHASGLPIYVFPKNLTTACAIFAVRYGSLDCTFFMGDTETACPAGVAHFLEHKLFENEDGSDSFAHFATLGADANAFTSYDRTAYTFNCSDRFDEALAELLQFVTHPHFTAASVKKEQRIIAEEIRMYTDNPWERCFRNLLRLMYRNHPMQHDICGTEESIKRISPEILYDCYHSFYTPENMVLAVCGNVTAEQVLAVADRVLPQSRGASPARVKRAESAPRITGKRRVTQKMPVAKPLFSIGVKDRIDGLDAPTRFRREMALSLLSDVLFSRAGRLYNDLFERQIISPAFSAGYSSTDSLGFFCISGEADHPEEVLRIINEHVAALLAGGIPDEDFERCRRVMYADEIRAYDSTEEIANRLVSFALDGIELFSCPALLQSLTKRELECLLAEIWQDDRIALSVIAPQDKK